jgi:hypothetical protein
VSDDRAPEGVDLALEFARFCYRRRHIAWPQLYDEMCNVAGHGLFRGMGYLDLAEHGISFGLDGMPRLADLTRRIIAEEAAVAIDAMPELTTLSLIPATS